MPTEVLGQPLRELGGKVVTLAPGQVLAEGRENGLGCLLGSFERGELGPLPDLIDELLVLHALTLPTLCLVPSRTRPHVE